MRRRQTTKASESSSKVLPQYSATPTPLLTEPDLYLDDDKDPLMTAARSQQEEEQAFLLVPHAMGTLEEDEKKSFSLLPKSLPGRRRLLGGIMAGFLVIVLLSTAGKRMGSIGDAGGASKYLGSSAVVPNSKFAKGAQAGLAKMRTAGRKIQIASWNMAAINNNPFEYWITYKENPKYEQLMVQVEEFLEHPSDRDVPVHQVFTQAMYDQLEGRMSKIGWPSIKSYWEQDFKERKIVSGFLKDPLLGSKRLASMPDRITNTINVDGGGQVFRPTVINMYEGDLSTTELWWSSWETFMFDTKLKIKGKEQAPFQMLQKIKNSKYPKITLQEEADSLPLQTMCGAIFDAILVHMMNTVSDPMEWQPLKRTMVENLNKKKVPHTLHILESVYSDSDIITLQEVSSSFIDQARDSSLGKKFHIVAPSNLDAVRDQNSVICLSKKSFPKGATKEITTLVEEAFPKDAPVAQGDLLAITATNRDGLPFVVASFHGDTNGLATIPVTDAIVQTMASDDKLVSHRLVFGLDANTYENATPGAQQDVLEYGKNYVSHGLTSCWGDVPNPKNYTTYNARTFLQPQLNKACKSSEKRLKGDVNPKDFILFPKQDFAVIQTWKDNTGRKQYLEDTAFPTLEFPSDHGILATILQPKP